MNSYLVTVRLAKDHRHDPKNKVTGPCPISQLECTDSTGQHHSFLQQAESGQKIQADLTKLGIHVTRIERIGQ